VLPGIFLKGQENHENAMTAGISAEIRTEHLSNTSLRRSRYADPLVLLIHSIITTRTKGTELNSRSSLTFLARTMLIYILIGD
jgi:hypothetical protein